MPDISMCASETCSLRRACARNAASGTEPSERLQSYGQFGDTPCQYRLLTQPGRGYYGMTINAPADPMPADSYNLLSPLIDHCEDSDEILLAAAEHVARDRGDKLLADMLKGARMVGEPEPE